ncbi:MAG: LabA-like NYN domain-containing protein, partial [Ktedonobacterales bacterium]
GVAGPAREFYPRTGRTERVDTPISPNQVGSIVTQAIQQQTDRLLAELRHQQMPPSMTVMFPPFPSTERVGIFVDVANLLYSSRSMRISLDFGRLLDFLRGNRQLKRAHAYAPTNPDPNAEQSFLSVVKGLGYRITTKNYKTFSSGAKKADLDLDMCMDIVRLVDSGAVDTVVLVSGDSDFLPLLEYCSDKGVRVEVAAFDDSAAMILRQSCDLFINLSLVDDIRA